MVQFPFDNVTLAMVLPLFDKGKIFKIFFLKIKKWSSIGGLKKIQALGDNGKNTVV